MLEKVEELLSTADEIYREMADISLNRLKTLLIICFCLSKNEIDQKSLRENLGGFFGKYRFCEDI